MPTLPRSRPDLVAPLFAVRGLLLFVVGLFALVASGACASSGASPRAGVGIGDASSAESMDGNSDSGSTSGDGGAEEDTARDDFPETLFVNPALVTDQNGEVTVPIEMADSITTWKVRADAHTPDGAIGQGDATFVVRKPLFIDLRVPPVLTVGDVVRLPIPVRNYTDYTVDVEVTVKSASWYELEPGTLADFQLPNVPGEGVGVGYVTIRAVEPGTHTIEVTADAGPSDTVRLPIRVEPRGLRRRMTQTIQLVGEQEIALPFPSPLPTDGADIPAAEQEALIQQAQPTVRIEVVPTGMDRLREVRQSLLRRPTGCLEQTLSTTMVNIELARSIRDEIEQGASSTDAAALQAELKAATGRLELGYQRILGFWGGDGFRAFPRRPRGEMDRWLNGYALYGLKGLAEFVTIDEEWIKALEADMLAEFQAQDRALTARDLFGVWGVATPMPSERDLAVGDRVSPGLDRVLRRLAASRPSFFGASQLALLLNIYATLGDDERYNAMLAEWARRYPAAETGDTVAPSFQNDVSRDGTVTGAYGPSGAQEVAGLVLLAMSTGANAGSDEHASLRATLTGYLSRSQGYDGTWRSTLTTAIGLRALILQAGSTDVVTVTGSLNRDVFDPLREGEGATMVRNLPAAIGQNQLILQADRPVEVRIIREMVFPDAMVRAAGGNAFDLSVSVDKPKVLLGDTVAMTVRFERMGATVSSTPPIMQWLAAGSPPETRPSGRPDLVARIGIPAGATLYRDQLDALLRSGRIDRYDLGARYLILYMPEPADGFEATFTLLPMAVGITTSPSSDVQEYYNEAGLGLAPSVTLEVAASE